MEITSKSYLLLFKREKDFMEKVQQFAIQDGILGAHMIITMQRPDAYLLNSVFKADLRVRRNPNNYEYITDSLFYVKQIRKYFIYN